jgi:phytoene synthase
MTDEAFAAFQRVALGRALTPRHPLDLLEGFRMDVEPRPFRTLEDTLRYAYHVAGVVGVMMAEVMGVEDRAVLGRAADLGLAFQLTNIARDVLEDARGGRVYLPSDWLGGLDASGVADPANRRLVYSATLRLLDAAEPYYASARWGLEALGFRSAWAVAAALGVYRRIGVKVRAGGPDGMDRRASTGRLSKLAHAGFGAGVALRAVTLDRRILRPSAPSIWRIPEDCGLAAWSGPGVTAAGASREPG